MVECGVWKGGSSMPVALALKGLDAMDRDLYLYDTYSGMSAPTDIDVSPIYGRASDLFSRSKTSDDTSNWCRSTLEEVRMNMRSTGYPERKIHFVQGKVEDTIPGCIPGQIALLRLDTDWYVSTKHELTHLFPRMTENAVLIIDDYGCWEGARKAVDEYIEQHRLKLFLVRIDASAYATIKGGPFAEHSR